MSANTRAKSFEHAPQRQRQQGVVIIIAIVAIVAMTFAVFAMLRTTSGNLAIAGNLAFKQNATSAGDLGVETARQWLIAQTPATLNADIPVEGYFATWAPAFDPLTYAWTNANSKSATSDDGAGNQVWFVIHRLCSTVGSFTATGQECVRPSSLNALGSGSAIGGGGGGVGGAIPPSMSQPYFRVTAQVRGPRSTLSYVQVIMY